MLRHVFAAGLVLAFVVGCATYAPVGPEITKRIVGKHIDVVIRIFGYPDNSAKVAGRNVYSWIHRENRSYTTQETRQTEIGPLPGNVTSHDLYLICVFKVVTDDKEIIIHWEFDGNTGACEYFEAPFRRKVSG